MILPLLTLQSASSVDEPFVDESASNAINNHAEQSVMIDDFVDGIQSTQKGLLQFQLFSQLKKMNL